MRVVDLLATVAEVASRRLPPGPHHVRRLALALSLAIASAIAYGLGTAFQHRTAAAHPELGVGSLLSRLFRSPLWLAGIATDGVGLVLQGAALRHGSLLLVQAVLPLGIIVSLAAGGVDDNDDEQPAGRAGRPPATHRHRLDRSDWLASGAVVAGIVGIVIIGHPRGPRSGGVPELALARVLVGAAVLAGLVVVLGARRPPVQRAGLLGGAAGLMFAVNAAALKGAVGTSGVLGMATRWQTYAFIVCALAGNLIAQRAFQAGPLSASLPVLSAVEPLAALAIGLLAFDERLRGGIGFRLGEVVAVASLVVGVVALSRAAGAAGAAGAHIPAPSPEAGGVEPPTG